MKIKSLETENFRSCPNRVYEFGKVSFLVGDNGKGKTSLENAVRYALNGKLPEDPIRHGEDHLKVTMVIDDGQDTKVERTAYLPDVYRVNGEEKKQKEFAAEVQKCRERCQANGIAVHVGPNSNPEFKHFTFPALWEFLLTGKTPGVTMSGKAELELVTDDGTTLYQFKSKPSAVKIDGKQATLKAVNALLSDRIGGDAKAVDLVSSSEVLMAMQMPDVAKYLMELIPVVLDFDKLCQLANVSPEESDILRPLFPAAPASVVPSDVASAYRVLYSTRTGISARKEALRIKSTYEGTLPPVTEKVVQIRLDELNRQIAVSSKIKEAWDQFDRRTKEREAATETLNRRVKEFNALGKVERPEESELQGLLAEETRLRQSMLEAERAVTGYQKANEPLQRMLNNLGTSVCPLCDKLVCKTDKTAVKNDLTEAIEANMKLVKDTQERLEVMKKDLAGILAKEEEVRNRVTLYNNKAAVYRQICDLKASIPEAPVQPEPMPDVQKLKAELATYQEWQKQYLIYNECQKAAPEYNEVCRQYELYNSLVRKCEPKKGLLTNVILKVLFTPFTDHLNEFVKSIYSDMEMAFQMGDSGIRLLCRPHGRDALLPIGALSTGEKYIAMLALMDLVSDISNVRILVFDNLEALDEETMKNLLNIFGKSTIRDRYDHVILAGVGHENIRSAMANCSYVNEIDF